MTHPGPRLYVVVFAVLIALTGLTIGVSYLDLGSFSTVAALLIAATKATLVLLFFMHLIERPALNWVVALAGFFWLGILLALTMSDLLTRGWLPVSVGHVREVGPQLPPDLLQRRHRMER
jgi:cytochrome c oxidase subunit 4